MKNSIKNLAFIIALALVVTSCSSEGLTLSDASSTANIEKILAEAFEDDSEAYELTLYAGVLEDNLTNINRIYKYKNTYFWQQYFVSSGGFGDPNKKQNVTVRNKIPFKISAIDVSIIPSKYQEALAILKEKELFDDSKTYYLSDWMFRANTNGAILSSFSIQYRVGSVSTGRRTKITYDDFNFKVNAKNKLQFIN